MRDTDDTGDESRRCDRCGGTSILTIRSKLPDSDLRLQVFRCERCRSETTQIVDPSGAEVLTGRMYIPPHGS